MLRELKIVINESQIQVTSHAYSLYKLGSERELLKRGFVVALRAGAA